MVQHASPWDIQVGGSHYKDLAIQPGYFSEKNELSFVEGCIVKRVCRYRRDGGKGLQDLQKIRQEIDMLIDLHYGEQCKK